MDIQATRIELAKLVLNESSENVLTQIQQIFTTEQSGDEGRISTEQYDK